MNVCLNMNMYIKALYSSSTCTCIPVKHDAGYELGGGRFLDTPTSGLAEFPQHSYPKPLKNHTHNHMDLSTHLRENKYMYPMNCMLHTVHVRTYIHMYVHRIMSAKLIFMYTSTHTHTHNDLYMYMYIHECIMSMYVKHSTEERNRKRKKIYTCMYVHVCT